MGVLDAKLRRDLLASRGLLIAVVMILALGISAYVANFSLYFNLELARRSYYGDCRMADFWIDIQKVPETELDRLARVPGVSELRSRIVMPVTLDMPEVEKPLTGLILSMPDRPRPVTNRFILQRGSYFSDSRHDEVIINDAFAENRGIAVGDRLFVLLNDRRQELVVIGTAISSEFIFARAPGAMIPDKSNYAQLYVKRSFAEEATALEGAANQICGLLAPEYRDKPRSVLQRLERLLEPYGEATSTPLAEQTSHQQLASDLAQIRSINLIIPSVFLCVSALILDVLMLRVAQQQRTVIGTLKAIGYSDFRLLIHYLKFGVVVGTTGGLAGAAFGYWLAGYMLELFHQLYELPGLVNRPYPLIILGCVGLGIGVACIGTVRGVTHVMVLTPAESMRPKPPPTMHRTWMERWRWFWSRIGFRWQMVLRGIARHRIRAFTNIFSAAMGTALILQTLQVSDALDELISFTFERMLVSDFDLRFKDEVDYGGFLEARRLPGVDYAEPVLHVGCTFYHGHRRKQSGATGVRRPARLTVPRDREGHAIDVPEHGIVLTDALAERLAAQPGDHITLVPTLGRRRRIEVPVALVVPTYVGMAAYADFDYLNHLVGEESTLNTVQAKVDTNPKVIGEFYRHLKRLPKLQGFAAIREQKKQLVDLLAPISTINSILILFAGLLCCGSITTASLISLSERKQEIATFRVLGYQPQQIASIFLRESLIVNSVGIAIGLPIGYFFAKYIIRAVATETTRLPFVIDDSTWWNTWILSLFLYATRLPAGLPGSRHDELDGSNQCEGIASPTDGECGS